MKTFKDKLLFFAKHLDINEITISEDYETWVDLTSALETYSPEWFETNKENISTKGTPAEKRSPLTGQRGRNFVQCVENFPQLTTLFETTVTTVVEAHQLLEKLFATVRLYNDSLGYVLGWSEQIQKLTQNKYFQLNQAAKSFLPEEIIKYYSKFSLIEAQEELLFQTRRNKNLLAPEEVNAKFLKLEQEHKQLVDDLTKSPQLALFSVESGSRELEKIDNEIILFGFDPLTDNLQILLEAPLVVSDYIRNKLETVRVEEVILKQPLSEELKEVIIGLHDPHERENPYNSIVEVYQAAINL